MPSIYILVKRDLAEKSPSMLTQNGLAGISCHAISDPLEKMPAHPDDCLRLDLPCTPEDIHQHPAIQNLFYKKIQEFIDAPYAFKENGIAIFAYNILKEAMTELSLSAAFDSKPTLANDLVQQSDYPLAPEYTDPLPPSRLQLADSSRFFASGIRQKILKTLIQEPFEKELAVAAKSADNVPEVKNKLNSLVEE